MKLLNLFPASSSLLGVVMFLLPFILVSCPGQQRNVTGLQLVTGTTVEQQQMFGPSKTQRVPGEKLALLALLLGAGSVAVAFVKGQVKSLAGAILSGAATVALLALQAKINGDVAREGQGLVQVSFLTAFWLAVVLFAVSSALGIYVHIHETREPTAQSVPLPGH